MLRIEVVPESAGAPFLPENPPLGRSAVCGQDVEVVAGRLLAYLAEPRPPMTIEELAAALDCGPLAVGGAILRLHDRKLLAVEPLPGSRFALRPTSA